ncbi:MAG TPA: ankyrin repeat domain-containing protein, partial [Spirochaetota bacterium]|nr:ankyrin repeat domain-containing protein [Spirochaetota bacterium]
DMYSHKEKVIKRNIYIAFFTVLLLVSIFVLYFLFNLFTGEFFILACKAGDKKSIDFMLKINPKIIEYKATEFGATGLLWAAHKGNNEIVKYLIERGAYVKAVNRSGFGIIEIAKNTNSNELYSFLIKQPQLENKNEIFIDASSNGDLETVKKYLNEGVDIEYKSYFYGATGLLWATYKGQIDVVKYLIEKGANINAVNNSGTGIIDLARDSKDEDVYQYITLYINSLKNKNEEFIFASREGDISKVKKYIENEGNIEYKCQLYGATGLLWAAYKGNIDIVKYLIGKGANINAVNNNGTGIMELAKTSGNNELIDYLKSITIKNNR